MLFHQRKAEFGEVNQGERRSLITIWELACTAANFYQYPDLVQWKRHTASIRGCSNIVSYHICRENRTGGRRSCSLRCRPKGDASRLTKDRRSFEVRGLRLPGFNIRLEFDAPVETSTRFAGLVGLSRQKARLGELNPRLSLTVPIRKRHFYG